MLPVNLLQLLINHRIHLFAGSCSVRNRPSEYSRVTQTNCSWQGKTIYTIIRSFYPPAESVLVHQEPGLQDLRSAAEPVFCPSSPAGIEERRCVTILNWQFVWFCTREREAAPRQCKRAQAQLWCPRSSRQGCLFFPHKPLRRLSSIRGSGTNYTPALIFTLRCTTEAPPGSGSAFRLVVTKLEGKRPTPLWFSPFHQFGSL